MKTLYLECNMGAAGDMLMSALAELVDSNKFIEKINALGIPDVKVEKRESVKCGITGTHIDVYVKGKTEEHIHEHNHEYYHEHNHEHNHEHHHEHNHEHHHHNHTGMHKIEHIVNALDLSDKVKADVLNVYGLIAEAESKAHNKPIEDVHFHEVGTMDAVADIVGVCMLMEEIGAEKVIASPINVGSGQVKCAHGILPVPAPATAHILRNVPIYSKSIKGELCTPTGAALLKYFADEFGEMPVMTINKIGYGMGSKDFEVANCVRAMIGETKCQNDKVVELVCNIDDMTGEEMGFACEMLRKSGALDVFITPVDMKKNRIGMLLSCVCKPDDKGRIVREIFKYTTTIGIREYLCDRYVLDREERIAKTEFGNIRAKFTYGYGVEKYKFEYDDLAKIAEKNNITIEKLKAMISKNLN